MVLSHHFQHHFCLGKPLLLHFLWKAFIPVLLMLSVLCNSIFDLGDISSYLEKAAEKKSGCCGWIRLIVYWIDLQAMLMGRRSATRMAGREFPKAMGVQFAEGP